MTRNRLFKLVGLLAIPLLATLTLGAKEWKPVEGHITTPWTSKVDPKHPLPEYPRPQMVRPEWINLNGLWDYRIQNQEESSPAQYEGKILVPYPIESPLSGVRQPLSASQKLWYRRSFKAPNLKGGHHLLLHFGAVDWEARVFINGKPVGEHRGGYDGFSFDITSVVSPGTDNELIVEVWDPTTGYQPKGKQNFNKLAKPGGIAYVATSGIWQTVWLETVPEVHVKNLVMTPDLDAGVLRLRVEASGDNSPTRIRAVALAGSRIAGTIEGAAGQDLALPLSQVHPWSPEDPFLYTLKVQVGDDAVTGYFGLRKIALGKDAQGVTRIFLNNKIIFQAGPLDQGFWPDGNHTAPTDDALRFDIQEMKKLGFNMVRKHLKVEPERWYFWCDKLGLLVWQDMPNGDGGTAVSKDQDGVVRTPEGAAEFELELKAMIAARRNHPAIVVWTIFNEGWGQYDTPRMTKWVMEMDHSRLINSTSGWHDQKVGDLVDTHSYPGPAVPKMEPARAAVLGEFGGLGLKVDGHVWVPSNAWGYRSTTGSRELTRNYLALWRQVWEMATNSGLCAAVYTQLTDVETECNGLLTYDRKVEKVNVEAVAAAHHGLIPPAPKFEPIGHPTSEPLHWRHTQENPGTNWMQRGFNDSKWLEGTAGFGAGTNSVQLIRTSWDSPDLWLRREFVATRSELKNTALKAINRADVEVYINGILAVKSAAQNPAYEVLDISPAAEHSLHAGVNVIAVHCHQTRPSHLFDLEWVREVQP